MFKFLFDRVRRGRFAYDVYYTYAPGTFVLKETIYADSEYDANRRFDQKADGRAHRLRNQTRLAR